MAKLPSITGKEIIAQYEKYKTQGRGRSSVATSNWPTALAHPCTAYGFYNRTVSEEKRRKIGADLAMIFSEGNDQARMVKRDLMDAGFEVNDQEAQMTSKEYQISGRQDMTVWKKGFAEKVHCEIKSCAPFTFDGIRSIDDLANPDKEWQYRWYKQITLYMFVQGLKRYLLILKNKSRGSIKVIEFIWSKKMLETVEPMLKKAKKINRLVQIGATAAPEKDKIEEPDYCGECPFLDVCGPNLLFGPGAVVLTDEQAADLAARLDRRKKLSKAHREYEEIDEEVKSDIKGMHDSLDTDRVVAENWIATIRESQRRAYEVKAQTVVRVDFVEQKEKGII